MEKEQHEIYENTYILDKDELTEAIVAYIEDKNEIVVSIKNIEVTPDLEVTVTDSISTFSKYKKTI